MDTIHTKTSCCGAKTVRFGERRRQCKKCKRTWRIRTKKRGRKEIRIHARPTTLAFPSCETLRHKAERTKTGREKVRRRHHKQLDLFLKETPIPKPPSGKLIAVVDA